MSAQPTNTNEMPHPYPRRVRDQIKSMSFWPDEDKMLFELSEKLRTRRSRPKPLGSLPFLGDMVFLPANLTRLVIDPYRESCNTKIVIGHKAQKPLEIAGPAILGGFPAKGVEPEELDAVALGAELAGVAVRLKPGQSTPGKAKVIRLLPYPSEDTSSVMGADAIELMPDPRAQLDPEALRKMAEKLRKETGGVPVGISVCQDNIARVIPAALEAKLDFATLFCMENEHEENLWPDESGMPLIAMLTETMERVRALNGEEDIDLLYFGCIQCGADIAKVMALGATAPVIGQSALIAIHSAEEKKDMPQALDNYLKAVFQETAILARCCGKTDINNLEPEDLRAFTIETARATGLPLVGKDRCFRI